MVGCFVVSDQVGPATLDSTISTRRIYPYSLAGRRRRIAVLSTRLIDSFEVKFKVRNVPNLSIPASIAALRLWGSPGFLSQHAWEAYAIEIIQAAVLRLIAIELIKVLKVSFDRFILSLRFQTKTAYLLSTETDRALSCDGRLEERILKTTALEDCRQISGATFPGAFIDKVVWSLIGSFQPFPATTLVYSVQLDAKRRGWGTSKGLLFPQFHPAPDRVEELVREQQKSRSLVEMFSSDNPEFSRALTTQIRKGIQLRTTITTWDSV
jgi:hypothetical protein